MRGWRSGYRLRRAVGMVLCLCGVTGAQAVAGTLDIRVTPTASPRYVEGEVLVRYHSSTARRAMRDPALTAASQRRRLRILEHVDSRPVETIRVPGYTTARLIDIYRRHPGVETVIPNYIRRVQRQTKPDDPRFPMQWGLLNTGQVVNGMAGTVDADIRAPWAWPMSRPTTQSVVIAVIDTGVDYRHPDLVPVMWRNPGENPGSGLDDDGNGFVDDWYGYDFSGTVSDYGETFDPGPDPMDIDGHGTHAAGIAAAMAGNGVGVAGVADARIMALKASPDGLDLPLDETLEAIAYAVMMKTNYNVPVAVINASYGGYGGSNSFESDLLIVAGNAGIVFCAAAGNDGSDNDSDAFYPANYRLPNVVAVAATDSLDALAGFSNFGETSVHLAAPGNNIISTVPLWYAVTQSELWRQPGDIPIASAILEFSGYTRQPLTAPAYDCGQGAPHQFPAAVSNNIALIQRGGSFPHEKVRNARAAGAVAVVIYNNDDGSFDEFTLMAQADWLPAVAISRADGEALLALPQPVTLTVSHPAADQNAYGLMSGTSMATPFVSGALAFMARQFPSDNPAQRIARLLETVDGLPALTGKVRTGGRLNLLRAVDSDTDGLPDWWENDWVGNLTSMDALSDYDGNDVPDLHEYLAGTDPTDYGSALRLAAVIPNDGGGVNVIWQSATNRTYQVLRATDLNLAFQVVSTNLPATPPLNIWTDTAPLPVTPVFYGLQLAE